MTVTRAAQPYGLVGQWSVLVEDALLTRCAACPYFEVGFERPEQLSRAVAAAVIAKGSRLAPEEVRFQRLGFASLKGWSRTLQNLVGYFERDAAADQAASN